MGRIKTQTSTGTTKQHIGYAIQSFVLDHCLGYLPNKIPFVNNRRFLDHENPCELGLVH